jgi:hypothetical protein
VSTPEKEPASSLATISTLSPPWRIRILVLDKGHVADQGTHEELVGRAGLYKTLYDLKNVDPALLRSRGETAKAPLPGTQSAVAWACQVWVALRAWAQCRVRTPPAC